MEAVFALHLSFNSDFLDVELIMLDIPSPCVGAGLNRESLLASYERVLTAHPNIRLVILGELLVCYE